MRSAIFVQIVNLSHGILAQCDVKVIVHSAIRAVFFSLACEYVSSCCRFSKQFARLNFSQWGSVRQSSWFNQRVINVFSCNFENGNVKSGALAELGFRRDVYLTSFGIAVVFGERLRRNLVLFGDATGSP